jgi:hypothetical protein
MTVVRDDDGKWIVVAAGKVLAGPFDTSSAAWRWIDRCSGEPISPAEKKSDWIVSQILGGQS